MIRIRKGEAELRRGEGVPKLEPGNEGDLILVLILILIFRGAGAWERGGE